MSNTAVLSFDVRSNKWTASANGRILAASHDKKYVVGMIRAGRCAKAALAGITDVCETDERCSERSMIQTEKFSINERFGFLVDFVRMIADRSAPSLIITGGGGLGKTYTVVSTLMGTGLEDSADLVGMGSDSAIDVVRSQRLFTVIKGYSTAKGLYRTLYENRNRIIVFDDCDSVLKDPVAVNLLKGALDSYDRRVISWNAES